MTHSHLFFLALSRSFPPSNFLSLPFFIIYHLGLISLSLLLWLGSWVSWKPFLSLSTRETSPWDCIFSPRIKRSRPWWLATRHRAAYVSTTALYIAATQRCPLAELASRAAASTTERLASTPSATRRPYLIRSYPTDVLLFISVFSLFLYLYLSLSLSVCLSLFSIFPLPVCVLAFPSIFVYLDLFHSVL